MISSGFKEDDKLPAGALSPLWDAITEKHHLELPPAIAVG